MQSLRLGDHLHERFHTPLSSLPLLPVVAVVPLLLPCWFLYTFLFRPHSSCLYGSLLLDDSSSSRVFLVLLSCTNQINQRHPQIHEQFLPTPPRAPLEGRTDPILCVFRSFTCNTLATPVLCPKHGLRSNPPALLCRPLSLSLFPCCRMTQKWAAAHRHHQHSL